MLIPENNSSSFNFVEDLKSRIQPGKYMLKEIDNG